MTFSRKTVGVLLACAFVVGIAVCAAALEEGQVDRRMVLGGALLVPLLCWLIGMRQHATAGLVYAIGVSVTWFCGVFAPGKPMSWWAYPFVLVVLYSYVGIVALCMSGVCAFLSWLARRIRK